MEGHPVTLRQPYVAEVFGSQQRTVGSPGEYTLKRVPVTYNTKRLGFGAPLTLARTNSSQERIQGGTQGRRQRGARA